ncbi:Cas10/Cmr2 second palm domain-containing protein [Vulcanococcus limneticus]|uniref:Cas10/Cmr2 second palm domain-containing protein n=1 Tax=Vulcanococcus limneticus TaxID=2170428 RepID=UPI00398BBD7D
MVITLQPLPVDSLSEVPKGGSTDDNLFTVVTFAPVQGFIGSSRKLRDLYGSSLLLSYLARAIVLDAEKRLGNKRQQADVAEPDAGVTKQEGPGVVISPALVNASRGTPNLLVIRGDYKWGHGRDALKKAWSDVLLNTRSWIEAALPEGTNPWTYEWATSWTQWQEHAWEYFHAQGSTISLARRQLALSKQQRAWSGINWTGESSTLKGSDAICRPMMSRVIDPRHVSAAAVDEETKAFIKALRDLPQLGEAFAGEGEQLSIPELVKRLVTYPVISRDALAGEKLTDVRPERFDAIASSRSLCWFMADGDSVGQHLEKQSAGDPSKEPEALNTFSDALRQWAAGLYRDVPAQHGNKATVIYAGGDDLLGALHDRPDESGADSSSPLKAHDIHQWLRSFPVLWESHGQAISVSMGLAYVKDTVPQREALQHVREAERSAKDRGRNRFALRLVFSGGQSIEWVCPWKLLPKLLDAYRDRHPSRRSGIDADWGHLAADTATLRNRRALNGSDPEAEAVALALWRLYFPQLADSPPPLEGSGGIGQPLGDWLHAMGQVLSRLPQGKAPQEVAA